MTDKMFKVGGVSNSDNGFKVRFANDMTRVKNLGKGGNDVQLMDLPNEMTKAQVVTFLKTTDLYANLVYREAIDNADEKYNPVITVKVAVTAKPKKEKVVKAAPSLEAIKARKPKVAVVALVAEEVADPVAE